MNALGRWLWVLLRFAVLTPALLWILANLWINHGLLPLINQHPERVRVEFQHARMGWPGQVEVTGLRIRGQGPRAQWMISADEASGTISLLELADRTFHASDLNARGLSLRFRIRKDAPGGPPPTAEAEDLPSKTPPIEGLTNPPVPRPEDLWTPKKQRWTIRLDDIRAEEIRELWVEEHRFTGLASAYANLAMVDPFTDLDGVVTFAGLEDQIGETPVAQRVDGDLRFDVDHLDRRIPGAEQLNRLSGRARLQAEVQDLRFLDFYLASVPWLALTGAGALEVNATVDHGRMEARSELAAQFPELVVSVLSNRVTGAGHIHGSIGATEDGTPQSLVEVDFEDFAIAEERGRTLVEGRGFHVGLDSPHVSFTEPFTTVNAVLDLPSSRIPDIRVYNAYLPQGIGLALRKGHGFATGRLEASSLDRRATGRLSLSGKDLEVQLDDLMITADLDLGVRLAEARLVEGHYDLSGTVLRLDRVGMVDQAHRNKRDGDRDWSATISLPEGTIDLSNHVYLEARASLECSDAAPFIAAFAQKQSLPRWVQKLLGVKDVSGEAHLRMGATTLDLDDCEIRAGKHYQVNFDYQRNGASRRGLLLVRAGLLKLGVTLNAEGSTLKVFGANRWFNENKDGDGTEEEKSPRKRHKRRRADEKPP